MQTMLTISLILNILLFLGGAVAVFLLKGSISLAERVENDFVETIHSNSIRNASIIEDYKKQLSESETTISNLALAVAKTVKEIRSDIGRNYHHVHDGSVLDRIAWLLKEECMRNGNIEVSNWIDTLRIQSVDAKQFIADDGTMALEQVLDFAWTIHAKARARCEQVFEVVQESCGPTNISVWLSRTLSIFERILEGDKTRAIKLLELVAENWKYAKLENAILFATSEA